ncbi:ferrochelatase [Azoarcus sp. TTM-91]|uniref:ferrochelatase n=1 Tax=Azoarcus sp. TTM-91 TaxID=2691581 RepID=UPI00145D80BC|nr:ferrochelatase [Azoarcus sp. TTM-91]NMG34635.1 ferrochelatase [Azoarcus sp. TTM-91]
MARYWSEPASPMPQSQPAPAIVLVNLGTPTAPTAAALKPYLKQFLSDPRVVEIPRAVWLPILNGIILNTRPAKSAAKYATIWMDEGSPLKVHTERQAKLLAGYLGASGHGTLKVVWAMRYGAPSIPDTLNALKAQRHSRILIVPMYPQYAASTTASVMDEVARSLLHWRNLPEIRFIRDFHADPAYITSLAASVREHWAKNGQADRLVMSFHGIPKRSINLGDPYQSECLATARLLAQALELPAERLQVTFQSRFGKAEWLQPYTQPTLEKLAREGVGSVDVMCPGFVADCLETLEEIAMECREAFLANGGQAFNYIHCLNERDDWIEGLKALALRHLDGWWPADGGEHRHAAALDTVPAGR